MLHPNFKLTNKIVNSIAEISASREVILNASILPQWDIKLKKDAILKRVHHSTSIEGNPLTFEQVEALIEGRPVAARDVDKQEVLNYVKVLEYIDNLDIGEKKEKKITEEMILKIHRLNTQKVLSESKSGHYREGPVYVVDEFGKIIYEPPPEEDVPKLMKEFIEWINRTEAKSLYPVLEAGICHYELVRIHPFYDGNGRTARALATLILCLRGFDTKKFFALDDYYNEDRERYYAALQTIDPKTVDITKWLEYFVEGVAVSMGKVKETVLKFSLDKRFRDLKGQVFLDEKQMKTLEYLLKHGRITASEYLEMFDVSVRTARNHLNKLIELDLIKPVGPQKKRYYQLK